MPNDKKSRIFSDRLPGLVLGARKGRMELAKIETLEQNEVGMKFYPKMGFREVARQIHYVMLLDR